MCRSLYFLLACLLLCLTACEDLTLTDDPAAGDYAAEAQYWHTRTLSRAEQQNLKRWGGMGFTYDAVYGSKCDLNSLRGQALNADALQQINKLRESRKTKMKDYTEVAHSFAEYCQVTNLSANLKADVVVYNVDYEKAAAIFEQGMDTTYVFHNQTDLTAYTAKIDTLEFDSLRAQLFAEPERFLSPGFRYAIDKIRRDKGQNLIVVDSFIDIYGTHVITEVELGAQLKLDMMTNRKVLRDYALESTIKEQHLNLFFYNKDETTTEIAQELMTQILNNSTFHLEVKGGETKMFNSLIVNPSPNNPAATSETLNEWVKSIDQEGLKNVELIEMKVIPIWYFIPDTFVANLVHSRIEATAPTMQALFGNLNFVNVSFNPNEQQVVTRMNGKSTTFNNPWVYNILANNRVVATVCREWVPELSLTEPVNVAYPVYDNKIDLSGGLTVWHDSICHVAWLYDQFVIRRDTLPAGDRGDRFYLTCGMLTTSPYTNQTYQKGTPIIGYEWPGSINIDGSTAASGWRTTRKFLGNFYLENAGSYSNLPGWYYQETWPGNAHYVQLVGKSAFAVSGIQSDHLNGRMVRNPKYTYYYNPNEARP